MRAIKFRGKSIVEVGQKVIQVGEWVYGGIAYDDERAWIDTPYIGQVCVDRNTVGQYTGLRDKNGKEIYEGDIVKVFLSCKGDYIVAEVKYSEEYAQYIITNTRHIIHEAESLGDYNEIEVIGNIYENPELLVESDVK